jgi:hypothetical protein
MERAVPGNWHAACEAGEKLEIISNAYLLQPRVQRWNRSIAFFALLEFTKQTGRLLPINVIIEENIV